MTPLALPALLGAIVAAAFLAGRFLRPKAGDAVAAVGLAAQLALLPFVAGSARVGDVVLRFDGVGVLLALLAGGAGLVASLWHLAGEPARRDRAPLVVLAALGATTVGLAADLLTLWVAFEVMALASFALVAQADLRAGARYLVVNAAGSMLALAGVGFALLATRSLALAPAAGAGSSVALAAAALLVVGFGAKAAVAPMHAWLASTYESATPGVSALLGGSLTATGLFAMLRALAFLPVGSPPARQVGLLLALLAVATSTLANLTALRQTDAKRVLAYSSLAHLGYVLLALGVGLAYGARLAFVAAALHALAHGALKSGAFLAAGALEGATGTRRFDAWTGAARRAPWAGAAMLLLLAGLAGVPPTVGFLGKALLGAAVAQGAGAIGLALLVAYAANALVSLLYYVPFAARLVEWRPGALAVPRAAALVPLAVALVALTLGLLPGALYALASRAADALLGGV